LPKVSDIKAWSKCFPRRLFGDALGLRMGCGYLVDCYFPQGQTISLFLIA